MLRPIIVELDSATAIAVPTEFRDLWQRAWNIDDVFRRGMKRLASSI